MPIAKVFGGPSGYGGTVFVRGPDGPLAYNTGSTPADREVTYNVTRSGESTVVDVNGIRSKLPPDVRMTGQATVGFTQHGQPQTRALNGSPAVEITFDRDAVRIDYLSGRPAMPVKLKIPAAGKTIFDNQTVFAKGSAYIQADGSVRIEAYAPDWYDSYAPTRNKVSGALRLDADATVLSGELSYLNYRFAGNDASPLSRAGLQLPLAAGRYIAKLDVQSSANRSNVAGTRSKAQMATVTLLVPAAGNPRASLWPAEDVELKSTGKPGVFSGTKAFTNGSMHIEVDLNTGKAQFHSNFEYRDHYRGSWRESRDGDGCFTAA